MNVDMKKFISALKVLMAMGFFSFGASLVIVTGMSGIMPKHPEGDYLIPMMNRGTTFYISLAHSVTFDILSVGGGMLALCATFIYYFIQSYSID